MNDIPCTIRKKLILVNEFGGKCTRCEESHICSLTFHHTEYNTKLFTIGTNYSKRLSDLRSEASKCIILCRNCHKKEHSSNKLNVHSLRKIKALEYKNSTGCEYCGYCECNDSLDFHHLDMSTKEFSFRTVRFSPKKDIPLNVKNELDKCIVLCANCHAKQHVKYDISLQSNGDHMIRIINKSPVSEILSLNAKGKSLSEICDTLDIAKSTASTVLKKNGITNSVEINEKLILDNSAKSVNELTALTGHCKSTIYGVLRANNITPVKKDYKKIKLKIKIEELISLRECGKSFREIGEIYNVSWKAVRDRAIKLGVYSPKQSTLKL